MLWGDGVAFMPRDVPVAALLSCLRMALDLPAPTPGPAERGDSDQRRPPSMLLDLEGWLAFVLLALPMFGGELPVAIEAALPHARRMLLALGMIHSGDTRAETMTMLQTSRRELRRIVNVADLDPDPDEVIQHRVDRFTSETTDA